MNWTVAIRKYWLATPVPPLISWAAAVAISLIVFVDQEPMRRVLWATHGFWAVLVLILLTVNFATRRGKDRKGGFRQPLRSIRGQFAFLFLLPVAGFLVSRLTPIDGRTVASRFSMVVTTWLVIAPVVYSGPLIHHWRRTLLAAASTTLALAALAMVGPAILSNIVVKDYYLDIDHRTIPFQNDSNENGVHPSRPSSAYRPEDFNIIFLGDSFTEGTHVSYPDVFSALVEAHLRKENPRAAVQVVNFGWASSGALTQLRQLRDIGARYNPDLIVQVFDMTDFDNDLWTLEYLNQIESDLSMWGGTRRREVGRTAIFRAMLIRFGSSIGVLDYFVWFINQLRFNQQVPYSWVAALSINRMAGSIRGVFPGYQGHYWFMWRPIEMSEPFLETSWNSILQINELARNMGARYSLFVLPRYQHYNRTECPGDMERSCIPGDDRHIFQVFDWFERKAATVDFPVHSLLPDFRNSGIFPTVFEDDFHFNESGHRVAADAIVRYLDADGLLPVD